MQSPAPVYHTICFLCQSAAEKFLKGYLIAQGWTLEKTHDLVALLGYCIEYDPQWRNYLPDGAVLNEYIIAGRYPGDVAIQNIGKREAGEALLAAQHIQALVRRLIHR